MLSGIPQKLSIISHIITYIFLAIYLSAACLLAPFFSSFASARSMNELRLAEFTVFMITIYTFMHEEYLIYDLHVLHFVPKSACCPLPKFRFPHVCVCVCKHTSSASPVI
jgi:hypothetical protein